MLCVFTGLPGQGKSYKLGQVAIECLYENKKYFEETHVKRILYSNMKFEKRVVDEFYDWQIEYWVDVDQLVKFRDCDVLIDEMALYFDSQNWQNMSTDAKRFFQQHRRYGVDIYGAAQDFAQVDKSVRRVTTDLFAVKKHMGSRDISTTRENPKFVWGVCTLSELDPQKYDEMKSKFSGIGLVPNFMLINKSGTEIFNTREELDHGKYPPLKKVVRVCLEDGYKQVRYV